MNLNPKKGLNTDPRHRLLEAAGEAFAERGFRGTTVREICKRAETNMQRSITTSVAKRNFTVLSCSVC